MRNIAITGGTGFIGRHVIHALGERARIRVLTRRPQALPSSGSLERVYGDLSSAEALQELLRGCDTVLHLAGTTNAPSRRRYFEINADGTRMLARTAARCGVRRFLLVSSLAATVPGASAYAASKARAETELAAADIGERIVIRPPAVYGPGDSATFEIFRGLARGFLVMPASARMRFSLLYVEDLADLLAELAVSATGSFTIEPDDGKPGGYAFRDLAAAAERRTGRPIRLLLLPRPLGVALAVACTAAARLSGGPSMVPIDKIGEFYHSEWLCRRQGMDRVPGWRPRVSFEEGLERTLDWYRAAGWL